MDAIKRLSYILDNGDENSILYVPMISMRSYETNLYDLTCDGNFNRFSSVFLNVIKEFDKESKDLNILIVLPSLSDCTKESVKILDKLVEESNRHITITHTDLFPSGGPKQERSLKPVAKLADYVKLLARIHNCSTVIYEANYLGVLLEGYKEASNHWKTIYWCPVSDTMTFQPDFLKKVTYVDQELAQCCDYMLVAVSAQKQYFDGYAQDKNNVIVLPMLIDPSLPMFKYETNYKLLKEINDIKENEKRAIIYFPFRVTDPGYCFREVADALVELSTDWNLCLVYSNPNDSDIVDDVIDMFDEYEEETGIFIRQMKIQKDRDCYYTMIAESGCIVPYFEDVSEVMHASWQEMEYFRTTKCVRDQYQKTVSIADIVGALEDALTLKAKYAIASNK